MKILFLSRWFPFPPDNGARIRIYNLLKILAPHHDVDLVSFAGDNPSLVDMGSMRDLCRKVTVVPFKAFDPASPSTMLGFLSRSPRSVSATFSESMMRSVEEAWRTRSHDLVIASELDMAPYARNLTGGLKVLEEVELTSFWDQVAKETEPLRRVRRYLMWWKLARYVRRLLWDFDACTVVSELERARLESLGHRSGTIEVVPNGVDLEMLGLDFGSPNPKRLIYPGSVTYSANFEAVDFFARKILPLVRRAKPDVEFYVTGTTEGVSTDQWAEVGGINLTGHVDDIRRAVGSAWMTVVPLLSGGGTRLKVLESMALGTPVVSTSKGVEGLDIRPGREYVLADSAEAFADAVIELIDNPQARNGLSKHGRRAVAERYGWSKVAERVLGLLEQLQEQAAPGRIVRFSHAT